MTRKEWEKAVLRREEKYLGLPPGWWGGYHEIESPRGVRVRWTGGLCWIVRDSSGKIVSKHDSRAAALRKAKTLGSTLR